MDLVKRLGSIIQKDKNKNPKYLSEIIKSDIYYMLNNYFEVDFDLIDININLEEEKYVISITAQGERLKLMKALPE